MLYVATYLTNEYTVADALRPDPNWGTRRIRAEITEPHSDSEVVAAARNGTPDGHWLHKLEAVGGEPHVRQVFLRRPPARCVPPAHVVDED